MVQAAAHKVMAAAHIGGHEPRDCGVPALVCRCRGRGVGCYSRGAHTATEIKLKLDRCVAY